MSKRQRGEKPGLGYEPRDINKHGAVEVICRRVQGQASGFDEVGVEYSYEAIVDRYPDRFPNNVVAIARSRLAAEEARFAPTADTAELERQVGELVKRLNPPVPMGQIAPKRS